MRTVQSESVDYPSLLDTNSSESTIYERSDIVPVEREGQTYYRYTEHQYSFSEWLRKNVPQITQVAAEAKAEFNALTAKLVEKKVITLQEKEDLVKYLAKLEKSEYAENTKKDYKVAIKRFYKWLNGDTEYPKLVTWIKANVKRKVMNLKSSMTSATLGKESFIFLRQNIKVMEYLLLEFRV